MGVMLTFAWVAFVFAIGYFTGKSKQLREDTIDVFNSLSSLEKEISEIEKNSIDGNKLIAWIENYQHNYEYVAPPTTSEIIRKIQEMINANKVR